MARPTVEDRNLANLWRKLVPGNYTIEVEDLSNQLFGFAKALLKTEGAFTITLPTGMRIHVVPGE